MKFLDLEYKGQPIISPGDIVDKLIILEIKLKKLNMRDWGTLDAIHYSNVKSIEADIERTLVIERNLLDQFLEKDCSDIISSLKHRLFIIHSLQWDAEDEVRMAPNPEKGWKAAVLARQLNTQRVQIKNEINQLFRATEEIKSYKDNR